MKSTLLSVIASLALVSCASSAKLINSATYEKLAVKPYVTPVQVDLQVSPVKISHFMLVSKTVLLGGYDNVVASAVKEALEANGNADVIVGLQTQVKYNDEGEIESIGISGFPAKYVNFRNCDSVPLTADEPAQKPASGNAIPFSIGKKKK